MESDILLQNDRLRAEIAPVGKYSLTRFDWTGNVVQVTLDGKHTFLGQEFPAGSPKMGGIGLHNEFLIDGPGSLEETEPGGQCIKLGIGLLRKPDGKPYNFMRRYDCEPFPVRVSRRADRAVYHTDPVDCGGFALEYEKTVRLDGTSLILEYRVKNHGKAVRLREYNHNFLLLGGHPVGPDYLLECAHIPPMDNERMYYRQQGNTVRWDKTPEDYFLSRGEMDVALESYDYRLTCAANGLSVACRMDFRPVRLVLYGRSDSVCPEVYAGFSLPEGGEAAWARRYDFAKG